MPPGEPVKSRSPRGWKATADTRGLGVCSSTTARPVSVSHTDTTGESAATASRRPSALKAMPFKVLPPQVKWAVSRHSNTSQIPIE